MRASLATRESHQHYQQVHATATEAALADKSLEDESVIQAAITALASEVVPDEKPVEPSPEYKVALTQNILYKVRRTFSL